MPIGNVGVIQYPLRMTPTSLKWLLTRRARILGEIDKVLDEEREKRRQWEKEIGQITKKLGQAQKAFEANIASISSVRKSLEQDLEALDTVIRLHEIPIDPSLIGPLRTQENPAITASGALSSCILECLRLAKGKPRTTGQIALYVATQLLNDKILGKDSNFRYRVRMRLCALVQDGKVKRLHSTQTQAEGRWQLNDIYIALSSRLLQIHQAYDDPANNPSTIEKDHC